MSTIKYESLPIQDEPDVLDRWGKWWQDWEHLAQTKFRYIADQADQFVV